MSPSPVPLPVKIVPAPDLIRRYTSFDGPERRHLESLMAFWSLLADFSFSDLLLFAPVTRDRGEGDEGVPELGSSGAPGLDHLGAFVVLGQMRPTTSHNPYQGDPVRPGGPVAPAGAGGSAGPTPSGGCRPPGKGGPHAAPPLLGVRLGGRGRPGRGSGSS